MADTKISDLPQTSSVADGDLLPVVNGGSTKAITAANLATQVQGRLTDDANGSIVEQNYFAYAGFTEATGRNSPSLEGDDDLESDKQEHGIYFQTLNGRVVCQYNTFYKCASFMFQMRPGGWAYYNFGYDCGNPLYAGRNDSEIVGNVIGNMVNISNDEASGKGYGCFGSVPSCAFRENIGYDRNATAVSGQATNDVGTLIYATAGSLSLSDNVGFDWKKEFAGAPYSLFANDVLYDMAPGHASHDYDGAIYDLDAPANYDDFPKIEAADHAQLIGRKLGEWRPNIDHPGARINAVRQKAYDGVLAKYGVARPSLAQKEWPDNVATAPGGGAVTDGIPEPNLAPTITVPTAQDITQPTSQVVLTGNRDFTRVIELAGLKVWAEPFKALRRRRTSLWKSEHPAPWVNIWMGHSESVSRNHYVSVPAEAYSGGGAEADNLAEQVQSMSEVELQRLQAALSSAQHRRNKDEEVSKNGVSE